MPENLDELGSKIRRWRSSFVALENSEESNDAVCAPLSKKKSKKSKKKSKHGALTNKEARQRASNWERLKASLN